MTSQGDESPGPAETIPTEHSLEIRKTRSPTRNGSPTRPSPDLFRPSSPASIVSRSTTLSGFLSRSDSPSRQSPLSLPRFGRSPTPGPVLNIADSNDETRTTIVRAFSPVVGVLASPEAEDFIRTKGFEDGLTGLLQPYGERVNGKIVVRDSTGSSRAWDDFGVRFLNLKETVQIHSSNSPTQVLETLEELVEQYLDQHTGEDVGSGLYEMSPYYRLFFTRLLSSQSLSEHETFLHPVAAVIAISSSTLNPIETLRSLYSQTAQGSFASPSYSNPEYLRYYVLVHDDDHDEIAKSAALFDQMKRHFGLHCHLLRLKSSCPVTDDGEVEDIPDQEWMSASADVSRLQRTTQQLRSGKDGVAQIYTSDATAIRAFTRELVAQSVVPSMEQRISIWNEQIASRRRGVTGRLMSLGKRWGGLGGLTTGRATSTVNSANSASNSGNYDSLQGLYKWDTSEALLRKMADFAIMLRDYKLAASTYELLRSDYNNDKAWKYLAGANEMCCIANLLNPLLSSSTSTAVSSKSLPKLETFDQMLEAAAYSYQTRCNEPALAIRSILLTVELLKVRGRQASELASKWAIRALDMNIIPPGSTMHVLISERVASCLASQRPRTPRPSLNGSTTTVVPLTPIATLGSRNRKAALWSLTSAEGWMKLGRAQFAGARLEEARELYSEARNHERSMKEFTEMSAFVTALSLEVRLKLGQSRKRGASGISATGRLVEPEPESESELLEDGEEDDHEQIAGGYNRGDGIVAEIDGGGPGISPTRRRKYSDPLRAGQIDDDFE